MMKLNALFLSVFVLIFLQSCSEDLLDKLPEKTESQSVSEEAVRTKED